MCCPAPCGPERVPKQLWSLPCKRIWRERHQGSTPRSHCSVQPRLVWLQLARSWWRSLYGYPTFAACTADWMSSSYSRRSQTAVRWRELACLLCCAPYAKICCPSPQADASDRWAWLTPDHTCLLETSLLVPTPAAVPAHGPFGCHRVWLEAWRSVSRIPAANASDLSVMDALPTNYKLQTVG